MISVKEMMTYNPKTLTRYCSLNDARKLMNDNKFRHIPIVGEFKQLIGLVTQRNVLSNSISAQNFIDADELAGIDAGTLIGDIMTTEITTVQAEDNILDAAKLIYKTKYGCLPVVDKNYCLIGIITDHDFVAMTIQLLAQINSTNLNNG